MLKVYTFICLVCNQQFTDREPKRKYCSPKCAHIGKTVSITKICKYCNSSFVCKDPNRKFCSPKCSNRFNQPITKKVTLICEWCGKQFEEWECHHSRFCSHKCTSSFAARQPKLKNRNPLNYNPKPCPICGKIFTGVRKFCSEICENENQAIQKIGKNNPNWVGGNNTFYYGANWDRQKRQAKKRDNYTCQKCGYEFGGNRFLDVHHIIPFRLFDNYKLANKLDNLITLCRTCHIQTELETRKINQT